jgi:hypothetical protein
VKAFQKGTAGQARPRSTYYVLGAAVALALSGCVAQKHYLYSSVANSVELGSSPFHQFKVVRVYADDGDLVVYGKVGHSHSDCSPAARVGLSILDASGTPVLQRSLPLVDRGTRRRGWSGAAFRARVAGHPRPGDTIVLAFQDRGCTAFAGIDRSRDFALAELPPDR